MPWHTVIQGQSIASIAQEYGFTEWRKIFDHPENASLRKKRPQAEILFPGDEVFIPDKELQEYPAATDKRHRFVALKPKAAKLQITVKDVEDKPIAGKAYKLTLDETLIFNGTTDGNGKLEVEIPVTAKEGMLEIENYKLPVRVSHLDPIDEITGIQGRLHNLGYDCGPIDGALSDKTIEALTAFQQDVGLSATGDLDDATRNKIKEKYGC